MTATATGTGIVHLTERMPQISGAEMVAALVPPPQFADATFDTYRADAAFPSQQEAKDLLIAFSGGGAPAKRGGLFSRAEAGTRAEARRLPRRRIRRRQDAPARGGLPRDAGTPEVLRLVHRVHRAGRRARLQEHRRAVPRLRPAVHRRVRTRRPGRHDGDDAAAGRARRHRHAAGRDIQHPAERARRGPVRRAGLPPRDPRDVRELPDDPHRRHRLPPPQPRRARGRARATPQYEAAIADAATTGLVSDDAFADLVAHLARVHPSRYIRIIDGLVGRRPPRRRAARPTSRRRCGSSPSSTACTTPSCRSARPASRSTSSSPTRCSPAGYRKKYLRAISRLVASTLA